jgi:hypothetical protein
VREKINESSLSGVTFSPDVRVPKLHTLGQKKWQYSVFLLRPLILQPALVNKIQKYKVSVSIQKSNRRKGFPQTTKLISYGGVPVPVPIFIIDLCTYAVPYIVHHTGTVLYDTVPIVYLPVHTGNSHLGTGTYHNCIVGYRHVADMY